MQPEKRKQNSRGLTPREFSCENGAKRDRNGEHIPFPEGDTDVDYNKEATGFGLWYLNGFDSLHGLGNIKVGESSSLLIMKEVHMCPSLFLRFFLP